MQNTFKDETLHIAKALTEVRLMSKLEENNPTPAWSRLGFRISDETKTAYENTGDLEARRKAGLGISMCFPISRSSLWDSQPQGLPTHLTHSLSIPSILFPPSFIASIQEYNTKIGPFNGEWELLGRWVTVDHQLSCKDSITRSNNQVVIERFQKSDQFQSCQPSSAPIQETYSEICAFLVPSDQTEGERTNGRHDHSHKSRDPQSPSMRQNIFTEKLKRAAEHIISQRLKSRKSVRLAKPHFLAIGYAMENSQFCMTGEILAPCESYIITPLKLLKVIPTVLSQSLFDRDKAHDDCCSGFLSMDQTRRLLVLAEDDPKAAQLPLVGIWVSGIESLHSSFVWACLMRYRHCHGLGERVTQNDAFLLLSYQRSAVLQPPGLAQVCCLLEFLSPVRSNLHLFAFEFFLETFS